MKGMNIKGNTNRVNIEGAIKELSHSYKIDKELVLENVKEALISGYKKEINPENDLIIEVDPQTNELLLFEELLVVEKVNNKHLEIDLSSAQKKHNSAKVSERIKFPVLLSSFSYFAILKVSQVIKYFINVSESEKIYRQFIEQKQTILSGTIENIDYRYFSVDIGNIFAFVPKEEQIPFERLRHGEKVKFYVLDVFKNHLFGQVMGSRRCNQFLEALFALEVPEVSSNVIFIKKIVREPGIRAKVAISCDDETIDPIGSCIGRGGSRIKSISQELRGEKIDIFLWDDDLKQFIINACSPSKIVNITFLEEKKVRLIVLETQYPIAIGRMGSAVRLLAKITECEILIEALETYVETVDKIELNGNLSYSDLEKLEIAPEIISKCVDLNSQTGSR